MVTLEEIVRQKHHRRNLHQRRMRDKLMKRIERQEYRSKITQGPDTIVGSWYTDEHGNKSRRVGSSG